MGTAASEKERDRTKTERLQLLNAAFVKPTKIIDDFRAYMGKVRAQLHTACEQLATSMRQKIELEAQQMALGRNPDKELQLQIEATENEIQSYRALRDQHAGHIELADQTRLAELAAAYAEIEALGGKLTLAKARPAVAKEGES
jgi:uncharacterized protein (DUF849 family)